MKKIYSLLLLCTSLFTVAQVWGNVIIVKGHVTLTNGSPAKNKAVKIAVYLANSTASCSEQVIVTNNDGFYSKELSCTGGDIRRSRISVENCNGQILVLEKEVPSSKTVEANFTLCTVAPLSCAARFTADFIPASSTVPPFSVKFNSSGSEVSSGGGVIHRTWDFHDGTPLLYDRVDPLHSFTHAGTYEVCLTIKTTQGCESRTCSKIKIEEHGASYLAPVTIISVYPAPVHENLKAAIDCKNNNIEATITIVNVLGGVQSSKQVILEKGTNSVTMAAVTLPTGYYLFKLSSQYGTLNKLFYKL